MRWYKHASRLLAVSRAIANAITAQAPELEHKVYVIPNPVPFKIENLSGGPRSKIVLFVGRVHPEKGIEMAVRAMRSLPARVLSDWKLRIIGPHEIHFGGGGDDFLNAMQELGGPVEWVGPIFDQNALIAQYRSARIFVYPSVAETGEACPVAPIEAMANGCVVLVSNLECFRDYIDDRVTGFIFDHRVGTQALCTCLTHLLDRTDEQFHKISEAAHAKATEFAVDSVAQRYLDDFAHLLAQQ
jgi:glycosyltransferase involved in cell wall biosynthesis